MCIRDSEITPADMSSESQEAENIDLDIDRFIPMQVKLNEALEDVEAKMIKRALARAGNVQTHAAAMLGITKYLLHYKMKKYNI